MQERRLERNESQEEAQSEEQTKKSKFSVGSDSARAVLGFGVSLFSNFAGRRVDPEASTLLAQQQTLRIGED